MIPEFFQAGVDFSAPAAFANDLLQFRIAGLAYFQPQAVVGEDVESFDVVVGLSRHDGMHAAGVVADHAAERAAVVGGRVGRESQMMFFGGVAQVVENHSGLHPGGAPLGIDLHDVTHVAGEIEHQGDVAALPGERSSAAAAEERSAVLARERDGGDDVIGVTGKNHADRDLAIVGAVGGVESAAAGIETDVAADVRRKACSSAAASTTELRAALAIATYLSDILWLVVWGGRPRPPPLDSDFARLIDTVSLQ